MIMKIKYTLIMILFYLFRMFPICKNKIVICSYLGKGYGDNGKYIVNELLNRKADVDIVWLVNNINETFPEGVRAVKNPSIRAVFELVTAKVWIDNRRKPIYVRKRKNQFYINTWHGMVALKKVEKDAIDVLIPQYIHSAIRDSKMVDLFLAATEFDCKCYRDSFWYKGEIAKIGVPRNDILFSCNLELKETVRNNLSLSPNCKIVLYAPTFRSVRGSYDVSIYKVEWTKVREALNIRFGGNWVVLVRLHPNISKYVGKLDLSNNVIDVTNYADAQELLAAADIAITDYSSTIIDFGITGRPGFLYATDFDSYKANRGWYFEPDALPFTLSKSTDELVDNILQFQENNYAERVNEFYYKKLGLFPGGSASCKVCDIIENHMRT